MATIKLHSYL
ncbi:hypothetical protein Zm00014a_037992 [Zea mays]|uniref:Uncharacterized protein n=1 Tax=Zea mays TaxID=4577 RepID=A0A3L6G9Z0_MAIZE|nr:hypothetical protein Zm00014a_037992 [Zea mays]